MRRNTALKIINPIMAVLAGNQIITALLHGTIPYRAFEFFHKGGGIVLLALIVVHLILNFNWVTASYFRK